MPVRASRVSKLVPSGPHALTSLDPQTALAAGCAAALQGLHTTTTQAVKVRHRPHVLGMHATVQYYGSW